MIEIFISEKLEIITVEKPFFLSTNTQRENGSNFNFKNCLCRKIFCNECREEIGFILISVTENVDVRFLDKIFFLFEKIILKDRVNFG